MTKEEKQKAIDALKKSAPIMAMTQEEFTDYIQTLNKIMDWLEQEPTTKNDLVVDCISRKAALGACHNFAIGILDDYYEKCLKQWIIDLPPTTPIRPTGHWIFKKTVFDKFGNTVECSSCHKKWKTYDEIRWRKENKFCPNCGSDNREVEE